MRRLSFPIAIAFWAPWKIRICLFIYSTQISVSNFDTVACDNTTMENPSDIVHSHHRNGIKIEINSVSYIIRSMLKSKEHRSESFDFCFPNRQIIRIWSEFQRAIIHQTLLYRCDFLALIHCCCCRLDFSRRLGYLFFSHWNMIGILLLGK